MSTPHLTRLSSSPPPCGLAPLARLRPPAPTSAPPSRAAAGSFTVRRSASRTAARARRPPGSRSRSPRPALGDPDPQPLLRRRGHHRAARRAGDRRPRQRGHRAHRDRWSTPRTTRCPTGSATPSSCRSRCRTPAGEMLAFPTIQTCEKGETGLDRGAGRGPGPGRAGAPGAVVRDPAGQRRGRTEGGRGGRGPADDDEADEPTTATPPLGWAGLVAGLLGLAAGGLALARTRSSS